MLPMPHLKLFIENEKAVSIFLRRKLWPKKREMERRRERVVHFGYSQVKTCHFLVTLSLTTALCLSREGDRFACESVQKSTFRNGHFGSMFPIKQNLPTGTPGFYLVASLRLSLQSPTINPFLMTD